jgi:anaerobic magnesium-protoporphyrin IX monomethyl ester cyclase
MMCKVLFVYPNAVMQNPPPINIAIFYAMVKKMADVEIKLFDTTSYNIEEKTSDQTKENNLQCKPFSLNERGIKLRTSNVFDDFVETVNEYKPDLIAISCNEITISLGLELMNNIKDSKSLKLIGGVFPTFAAEETLKNDFIDIACVGEGEEFIVELINKLKAGESIKDIKNLAYKEAGKIVINPLRQPIDLDSLPIPDFDIFEENRFYRPMDGKVWKLFPIETSRGCLYNCSFCNSPYQRKLYEKHGYKNYFRKKSVDRIREEIETVVQKYNAEYIYFLSDTLLALKNDEFEQFCKMYEKFKLPFWCQNRPEMITTKRAKRLKDIGCHRMSIGIEHGNEEFRKNILKKPTKNSMIIKAFEILAECGIPATINNIIGFPYETRELVWDTINLNRLVQFDTSNANAFTPFRGTELYDLCIKEGYLEEGTQVNCITKGSVLNMPQLSQEEISGLIKTFSLYARMPEKYFNKIKLCEKKSEEANKTFKELGDIYKVLFFNKDDS